ncbi:Protein fam86a [Blyttiomyces sp. JEL0837]|nr:Protein fam86a [Blyttiomyces sp. JEL0837]
METLAATSTSTKIGQNEEKDTARCFRSYYIPPSSSPSHIDTFNKSTQSTHDSNSWLTIREQTDTISNGTTGLRTWPAGIQLIEHFLSNRNLIHDRSIVELGSGVGLLGLACGRIGCKRVEMTDCHEMVLDRLTENVGLNFGNNNEDDAKKTGGVYVSNLDWETVTDEEIDEFGRRTDVDVVFAADVAYDPVLIAPLVRVIHGLLSRSRSLSRTTFSNDSHVQPKSCVGFLSITVRSESTLKRVLDQMELVGIACEEVQVERVRDLYFYDEEGPIKVLRLTLAT